MNQRDGDAVTTIASCTASSTSNAIRAVRTSTARSMMRARQTPASSSTTMP
jgi:hypothetical protein